MISDQEFVEKIRRDLKRPKKIWWWLSGVHITLMIAVACVSLYAFSTLRKMIGDPNQVDIGLLLGGTFGATFSIFFFNFGHHAIESLTMALGRGSYHRMMKLMVEYHDERAKPSGTSPKGDHA